MDLRSRSRRIHHLRAGPPAPAMPVTPAGRHKNGHCFGNGPRKWVRLCQTSEWDLFFITKSPCWTQAYRLTVDFKKSKIIPNPNSKFHIFQGLEFKLKSFWNSKTFAKISQTCANPGPLKEICYPLLPATLYGHVQSSPLIKSFRLP